MSSGFLSTNFASTMVATLSLVLLWSTNLSACWISACWRSGGSMDINIAALIFSLGISLDGCHHELHARHRRRGAVPLRELSPRFESTESARAQHLEDFALDQGFCRYRNSGTQEPICLW